MKSWDGGPPLSCTFSFMDILATLNRNYIPQLKVMLFSMRMSNPETDCTIYLMNQDIPQDELDTLSTWLSLIGYNLSAIQVDDSCFSDAVVTKQYPKEMYYRLIAPMLLPQSLDRILYLDPDILIINPLDKLWNLDIGDNLFAAAVHTDKKELAAAINSLRLGTKTPYFNSGVLLMNLQKCREEIRTEDIFSFVREHASGLVLPDQDVLNVLYGDRIMEIDDFIWNYDARMYSSYLMRSLGTADIAWVMENTSILHFCGRQKPWKPNYQHRFGILYMHYMRLAERLGSSVPHD